MQSPVVSTQYAKRRFQPLNRKLRTMNLEPLSVEPNCIRGWKKNCQRLLPSGKVNSYMLNVKSCKIEALGDFVTVLRGVCPVAMPARPKLFRQAYGRRVEIRPTA